MGTLGTLKTELIASEGYNNQTKPIRSHTLHFLELIAKKLKIRVRQFKKKLQIRVEISTPRLLYQITYENYFRHEIDLNEGFVGKCAYLLKAFCICLLLIDPFEIWWMKVWRQCKRSCRGIYMLQNCQGWVEWHQRMASCRLAWHEVRNKQKDSWQMLQTPTPNGF